MEQLVPWLTLKSIPGIGNLLFRRLVCHFGSPAEALQSSAKRLKEVRGMTARAVSAIQRHATPDWVRTEIERCTNRGIKLISQQDPAYPALLLNIPDPPPVLYCNGMLDGDLCHIAIVGSRRATAYGAMTAKRLGRQLADRGVSVISGMANGIDTAAHLGALDAGGHTVAVLGSGINRIYPARNRKLYDRIIQRGAVVTEFALDTPPKPHHFPQRNRIISGMALGTVVVEAAQRSGALITARLAAEQGREVYAVPGNIHTPGARGTHHLIKQGAKLVENAQDIIEEILPQVDPGEDFPYVNDQRGVASMHSHGLDGDLAHVLRAISHNPIHIDDLLLRCGLEPGPLTAILGELEIMGAIVQEPGKFFMRGLGP